MSTHYKGSEVLHPHNMSEFLQQFQLVKLLSHDKSLESLNLLDTINFVSPLPYCTYLTSQDFFEEYTLLIKDYLDPFTNIEENIAPEQIPVQVLERYACYLDIRFKYLPLLPELVTPYSYQDIFVNYLNKGQNCTKNLLTTLKRRRTILIKKLRYRALLEVYVMFLRVLFNQLSNCPSDELSTRLILSELSVRSIVNEQICVLGFQPV